MVTCAGAEIDWSTFPESDGEPMAETLDNAVQMVDLQWTLQTLFDRQGRAGTTTVGGNQFVYYNRYNGRDNISPDVYVAFDRPPPGPNKWQTWVEGKFPDIVFEITSPSTRGNDVGNAPDGKRARYAQLGAGEYYVYDPEQEMDSPFLGYALRGGRMEPLPALAEGGIYSQLLRAELRPVAMEPSERRPGGTWLRIIDPATGQPVPLAEEEHRDLQAARDRLARVALARQAAEERADDEAKARLAAEQARQTAEERVAKLEEALQALLSAPTRRQDPETDPEIG